MSRYNKPTEFGPRATEIQWLNSIVTTHGLFCGCEKPWNHLEDILKNQQVRCHLIGDNTTETHTEEPTGDVDIDGFQDGDLERLFAQDFEDDAG